MSICRKSEIKGLIWIKLNLKMCTSKWDKIWELI